MRRANLSRLRYLDLICRYLLLDCNEACRSIYTSATKQGRSVHWDRATMGRLTCFVLTICPCFCAQLVTIKLFYTILSWKTHVLIIIFDNSLVRHAKLVIWNNFRNHNTLCLSYYIIGQDWNRSKVPNLIYCLYL